MQKRTRLPIALTVAGSDSGGGAGIQADLKTFAALGVHGTSVITALTAQNPKRVLRVQPVDVAVVKSQLAAVLDEFQPQAIKLGMLFSAEIIEVVAASFAHAKKFPPLILDPVMVSTSGARLLKEKAVKVLTSKLFPLATLVTPNIAEAEALTGLRIREPEDLR